MTYDDVGRAWQGRVGGRTCPISAPLPDLMPALPFSSPGWLQYPSSSLSLPRPTVGSRLTEPLLQGTEHGDTQELSAAKGCPPTLP